jgi:hypothetical protein
VAQSAAVDSMAAAVAEPTAAVVVTGKPIAWAINPAQENKRPARFGERAFCFSRQK